MAPQTRSIQTQTAATSSKDVTKVKLPKKSTSPIPKDKRRIPSKAKTKSKDASSSTKPSQPRKRKAADSPGTASAKKSKSIKHQTMNHRPSKKLNVYVCGDVSAGELGLGPQVKKVMRPRLNPYLLPDAVGVVQVAVGGMHALALTHDNRVLSWGVNDMGALGRDTSWDGGMVDVEDDASESDAGMNPLEATPDGIPSDYFAEDVVLVQVAASDSASFALTDEGRVYGWGTFRDKEGKTGFTISKTGERVKEQRTPILLEGLKNITQIACGADHVLALDTSCHVYAWGNGEQNQLGRPINTHATRSKSKTQTPTSTLVPTRVPLGNNKIEAIGCGSYHSFAINRSGQLWSWGLNSYGEAGIPIDPNDDNSLSIPVPRKVVSLSGREMVSIKGGAHHSVGVAKDGTCFVWGRADIGQCGVDLSRVPEKEVVKDERGNVRIISIPRAVPGIKAATATAGSDHTIAVTTDGKAYSWGFNATYQLGQGGGDDPQDIKTATLIDNTALRDAKVNWAGAGGQFSIITAIADDQPGEA